MPKAENRASEAPPAPETSELAPLPLEQAPAPVPGTALDLPSEHILHSAVFEREMNVRTEQFDNGLEALQTELAGKRKTKDEATARLQAECDREVTRLTNEFEADKIKLQQRIDDMEKGRRMAKAALKAGEEPQ